MNVTYQRAMLNNYFKAYQPRLDYWNNIKSHAVKLADERLPTKRMTQHKKQISETLSALAHSEQYWGFPGVARYQKLRQLFEKGDYPAFAKATSKIMRLLMNDGYRHLDNKIEHELFEDDEVTGVPIQYDERFVSRESRPYFEVLVVDGADVALEDEQKIYRQRTAMATANKLKKRYASANYKRRYAAYRKRLGDIDDIDKLVKTPLLPDPEQVKIRFYATQSTHKTLTALRQGSMIHVYDEQYQARVQEAFKEAYMTHTSVSPNYQILASLDVGRRQTELEGFELVSKQIEMAMILRYKINSSERLKKYFSILSPNDMIPTTYRQDKDDYYAADNNDWTKVVKAWHGDDFERQYQIASGVEHRVLEKRVENLTQNLPPLPDFSYFHAAFRADQSSNTPEGKIRNAFFLAYDDSVCEYLHLDGNDIDTAIAAGRELVSVPNWACAFSPRKRYPSSLTH